MRYSTELARHATISTFLTCIKNTWAAQGHLPVVVHKLVLQRTRREWPKVERRKKAMNCCPTFVQLPSFFCYETFAIVWFYHLFSDVFARNFLFDLKFEFATNAKYIVYSDLVELARSACKLKLNVFHRLRSDSACNHNVQKSIWIYEYQKHSRHAMPCLTSRHTKNEMKMK